MLLVVLVLMMIAGLVELGAGLGLTGLRKAWRETQLLLYD